MPDTDLLTTARRRYPTGDQVQGRISDKPWGDGRTGVIVDLGTRPPFGFIDALHLPYQAQQWPAIGREAPFEVLQHRPGQVRLYPLDPDMRSHRPTLCRLTSEAWEELCARHPVGSTVTATVTSVYPSNREYVTEFDGHHAVLEYDEPAPTVGAVGRYRVVRLLHATQRIRLAATTQDANSRQA
ncbi:hypothetical protein [Actinocatenispora sera]|uniref:Uncharacterized protein n=1 Tax=Actinocatenispora sera TaxID=390989 RepID=A0A810KUP4_9ACTN|nr:hypothetical protein [Actinocatenispora sera]BCJ26890.1 hypothetical protein Asera_09980 [Actinocatenispora sera]